MENNIETFIKKIPKAELHIHIEGTIEPDLIFKIAKRNNVPVCYRSALELKKAKFARNLEHFIKKDTK